MSNRGQPIKKFGAWKLFLSPLRRRRRRRRRCRRRRVVDIDKVVRRGRNLVPSYGYA
jgi:hypothetical protein